MGKNYNYSKVCISPYFNKFGTFCLLSISILFIFSIFILTSCGLTSVRFLFQSATITDATVTGPRFRIEHNTENNEGFLGYEVYYKLYKKQSTSTEIDQVQKDRDFLMDSAIAQVPRTILNTDFRPLVRVDLVNDSFEIVDVNPFFQPKVFGDILYIDFSGFSHVSQVLDNTSEFNDNEGNRIRQYEMILYDDNESLSTFHFVHRSLSDTSTASFFSPYSANDSDLKVMTSFAESDIELVNNNMQYLFSSVSIELVIAVLPVGIDIANLQKIYGLIAVSYPLDIDWSENP